MSILLTRRKFIKLLGFLSLGLFNLALFEKLFKNTKPAIASDRVINDKPNDDQGISVIYEAKNGTPEQNVKKVIEMMGGIETIIGKEDIVILKPNAQWWNQGMTNTNAMKGFIELVLAIPAFKGEVIIAENHHHFGHRNTSNIRGWTTTMRNGDYNFNELVQYFQDKGHKNVTKYHWVDAGRFSMDKTNMDRLLRVIKEGAKTILGIHKGRIVNGPADGDGYVWSNIDFSFNERKTRMTYPIFTSQFSRVTIDFKNGAWQSGQYTGQPVKFINFPSLNHHSSLCGVTSAVKNYLGIVDISAREYDIMIEGYHNFHNIGFPAMGGAVGAFMNTIRRADLNIVTAEWVGFGSRTDPLLSKKIKTIIASVDPVALDYYGAKYILYPLGGPVAELNNPDNNKGPFRQYLELCCSQGIGSLDENKMTLMRYDFESANNI